MTIATTRMLEHRGTTIAVTALGGDGPTVVLLHGLSGSSRELLPTGRALQGYRVLLVDQPGHGRSTRRPDDLSRAHSWVTSWQSWMPSLQGRGVFSSVSRWGRTPLFS